MPLHYYCKFITLTGTVQKEITSPEVLQVSAVGCKWAMTQYDNQ